MKLLFAVLLLAGCAAREPALNALSDEEIAACRGLSGSAEFRCLRMLQYRRADTSVSSR